MPTLTQTFSVAQGQRIAAAFGKQLNTQTDGVPRDATQEEVNQQVKQFLKGVVFAQERQAAINAVTVADVPIT